MVGHGAVGVTHDFFCFNAAGQVWNGSAFVNWNAADFASYRVAATEDPGSGTFKATPPAGTYRFELRERGATLALSHKVWSETGPRETWTVVSDSTTALTIDRT